MKVRSTSGYYHVPGGCRNQAEFFLEWLVEALACDHIIQAIQRADLRLGKTESGGPPLTDRGLSGTYGELVEEMLHFAEWCLKTKHASRFGYPQSGVWGNKFESGSAGVSRLRGMNKVV